MIKSFSLVAAFIFISAFLMLPAFASEVDGTIDATYKYAWGENIGWINFNTSESDVHVYDSELTGYAWGENIGWISLNCSNNNSCFFVDYKVFNNAEGNLSGYAWGENIGWIHFNPSYGGVSINSSGEFSGYAWSENVGWIVFNCETTDSCTDVDYKIKTDWRPQSVRSAVTVSTNDLSNLADLRYIAVQEEITNTPQVTFKVEARTNVETTTGTAIVTVPDQTVVTRADGGTMDFTKLAAADSSDEASGVEDHNVVSAIQYGIPEVSLTFDQVVTISIPVDSRYNGEKLSVYKSDTGIGDWEPLTTCNVSNDICLFTTTSASYFAVTQKKGGGLPPGAYSPPAPPVQGFNIVINNNDDITENRIVTLTFSAGPDIEKVTISNYADFEDAILQEYQTIKEWDLCSKSGGLIKFPSCAQGTYTVYTKFYTKWGQSSEVVSDSIDYNIPVPVEVEELVPVEVEEEITPPEEVIEKEVILPTEVPVMPEVLIPILPPAEEEIRPELPQVTAPETVPVEVPFEQIVVPEIEVRPAEEEALVPVVEQIQPEKAPTFLTAAIANTGLIYGEITRSTLFTTVYVLLLLVLIFMFGKEIRYQFQKKT